jgi:hypothetical protein
MSGRFFYLAQESACVKQAAASFLAATIFMVVKLITFVLAVKFVAFVFVIKFVVMVMVFFLKAEAL